MAIAEPEDVAARFGELTQQQYELVGVLLNDIEGSITGRVPDLLQQINASPPTISKATVVKAEAWAVIRYLRNPDGKSQESIDDYSFTRDRATAGGLLSLTDDEWAEILPANASTAFTIRPTYSPDPCWPR